MKNLLCIGGPWDGKIVVVKQGQSALILPSADPIAVMAACMDSHMVPDDSYVTVHHHVYKVKRISRDMADSAGRVSFSTEVLAYYGRDRQDRPEGFYL